MAGKEIKKMKFLDMKKDSEKLMKLSEATFDGTLEELEDLIDFFKNCPKKNIVRWQKKRICAIRISETGVINGIRRIQILLW